MVLLVTLEFSARLHWAREIRQIGLLCKDLGSLSKSRERFLSLQGSRDAPVTHNYSDYNEFSLNFYDALDTLNLQDSSTSLELFHLLYR